MARHLDVASRSGFLTPLPDAARDEIGRRWPMLPSDRIVSIFQTYVRERDAMASEESPADVRARFASIRSAVDALAGEIHWLQSSNIARLMDLKLVEKGAPSKYLGAISDLERQLVTVRALLRLGDGMMPEGRRKNPRHCLVADVGALVERCGLPADAKPTGALVGVYEILLNAAGDSATNAPKDVRDAMHALNKSPKTI